jgi:hypothetical protein
MDIPENRRDTMRHTIMVLITLMAFGLLLAGEGADIQHVLSNNLSPTEKPAETESILTSSMTDFLSDSWMPSPYVADVFTAMSARKNGTLPNSSNQIYDFLNGTWNPSAPVPPVYTAETAGKDNTVAWAGESIYQFLGNDWTPSTPILEFQTGEGYKKHQMN